MNARHWIRSAQQQLGRLLPRRDFQPLLTEDLTDAQGRAIRVADHFGIDPQEMHQVLHNFHGLLYTAQASGGEAGIDHPPPAWPGFQDVHIPVADGVRLAARLGLARDASGTPLRSNCVVIMGGLFADNAILRTRDIAQALVANGIHALALEPRGSGQTQARLPDVAYTFGVLETGDLLAVDGWLQQRPPVIDSGLLAFCWGANAGLLAAWEDVRAPDDPAVSEELRKRLRPLNHHGHFRAGILACSPVLRSETIIESTQRREWRFLENPVLSTLQDTVAERAALEHYAGVGRDLRKLIDAEFARSELSYAGAVDDSLRYIRFLPHRERPAFDKLGRARVPILIVYGANDPLESSQDIADYIATVQNPNVAAIIYPDGGHVGFVPYARSYFYSLFVNFFDPATGPAADATPLSNVLSAGQGTADRSGTGRCE